MTDENLFALFRVHVDRLFIKPETELEKLLHAAVGICGEAGEFIDPIKKAWIYEKELDRENLVEEMGDLLFYIQAAALHIDPPVSWKEIIERNTEKLKKRYPQGYTDEAARLRADKSGVV